MSEAPGKVLIIKTGVTELLTEEEAGPPSLGEILRATCILHEYKKSSVTWVTAKSALPLLPGKPLLARALVYCEETRQSLARESFDQIINLERCSSTSKWAEALAASTGAELRTVLDADGALAEPLPVELNGKRNSATTEEVYQARLFRILGLEWSGQRYALPASAKSNAAAKIHVGFNHAVGKKWPIKAWPMERWNELAGHCDKSDISYSFQEGFDNLEHYIEWIQRHQLLVTNDSLGLHLALALDRSVIALFGPTRSEDIHFYGRGEALLVQSNCPIVPCFRRECGYVQHCMDTISSERVFKKVVEYIERGSERSTQRTEAAGAR